MEERVVTKHRTTVHETRQVDTNPHFRALHDCIDWCKAKIKQLQEADYGSDLPSVQNELDVHQREHKNIEQFHPKVDRCVQSKNHFHGEELTLYSQHLAVLQKLYTELLSASNKRLSDLDTLHDFIQSATGELVWLSSKEETEVTRDWSDKSLNLQSIEQYYEVFDLSYFKFQTPSLLLIPLNLPADPKQNLLTDFHYFQAYLRIWVRGNFDSLCACMLELKNIRGVVLIFTRLQQALNER